MASWIEIALTSCLDAVASDTIWIAPDRVVILRSWIEDERTFCVIYRHPWTDGLDIGMRSRRFPGTEYSFDDADPELWGQFTADDILEPLGSLRDRLRFDEQGVGWHGELDPPQGS